GTLNIVTTKFSGDGLTELGGIGISGAGAITINAGTSNLRGDIRVENALLALTIRDVLNDATTTQPQLIHAGGTASSATSITGHSFDGVELEIGGALKTLKVASFTSTHPNTEPARITAEGFGTLTATGDAANNLTGALAARLTNRNTLHSPMALTSLTADMLSDTWDLAGSVGSVTVKQATSNWVLGPSGPGTVNFQGVTATGNLSLADESASSLFVTGSIAALKATQVFGLGITAKSLGIFSAVADPTKIGEFGNVSGLFMTLTGNQAGMALKSLSVAASFSNSNLHFLDGNVGTFTVARDLVGCFITADATTAGGRFNTLTIGHWNNNDLDAKSVGTLKVIGNAVAGEFGDLIDSNLTLRGNMAGLGIGTFSVTGELDTVNVLVRSGGIASFTAGRGVTDSSLTLLDAALGNVKTVSAAAWSNTDLMARTIGTLKVTGAAQVVPASPLLVGDLADSLILAFVDNGTTPAIGTLSVAGGVSASIVTARHGITTLTVGRSLDSSSIVADDVVAGQLAVGRIGTLTVGLANSSGIFATTLGKVSVTGFTTQEGEVPVQFLGLVNKGNILAKGATPAGTKSGLDSLSVAGDIINTTVTARSGLGTLTVRGKLETGALTFDDPLNLSGSGKVGKVSAGAWTNTTIRANIITTLQTVPSPIDGDFGDFKNPTVNFTEVTVAGSSGAATDPVALTTFTVAGDLSDTNFNIPAGVKTFKVAGTVSNSDLAAGFAPNARIASVTAAAWDNTDVTTRVLSAMNVTGNTARAIAGNITDSLLTIMGNNAGVGLGTLLAQGTVSNSTFQVTDGNVTSFTVGKFLDSNLFVGFRPNSSLDLTQGGVFGATDRTIGLFKTTQAFIATDPDSVSFHNSNIVAADLGTITLTGVDSASDRPILFGIGFETGGTAGVLKVDVGAGLVTQTAPFASGSFMYHGL
ncbi:MAG TPA: hypothetical protein VGO11_22075, partial [Chthoniobacteraceae bacterium]|nr:hypothetical protein [Chthoniobacteraceae bacterium]